ncbi:MAG: hypothetical protein ABI718_01640 [Acidobacteriota bacterium]
MDSILTIDLSEPYRQTMEAVAELLTRLRVENIFVGAAALAAWMGSEFNKGSVDVLAAVSPEGSRQIPMMASHRGFIVERETVEAAEELDLVPMRFPASGYEIRLHVLIASNALYGNMIRDGIELAMGERTVKVISAEDLALLLTVAGDESSLRNRAELILRRGAEFDLERLNRRMTAIGLGGKILHG